MFLNTFSAGWPSFSYIAIKNAGSMNSIITIMAAELPITPFVRKYVGIPIAAAEPKHISCLLVRLNINLVLTLLRSLGTGTYAISRHPLTL